MGVVKSKYWRRKKQNSKDSRAPRPTPLVEKISTTTKPNANIIDAILELEDYELMGVDKSIKTPRSVTNERPRSSDDPASEHTHDNIDARLDNLEDDLEEIEEVEVLEELEKATVAEKEDINPYSIVTNVLKIFTSLQNLILSVYMSEHTVGSTVYINNTVNRGKEFSQSMENLKDNKKLEMWVWPLQPWQTGLVISKAKAMNQDHDQIMNSLEEYVASHASSSSSKKILSDDIKFFMNDLQMLYYCLELSTPEIMNSQIESLSYYMKAVIEAATITRDIDAYDIISRICTTESIKLGRICCMKGILQFNVELQRELNELSFSIIRAIKVLTVVGRTIVEDNTNINAKKNLVALATGAVKYFTRMSELAMNNEHVSTFNFTPEVVDRCISQYDLAVKEIVDALLQYKTSSSCDMVVVGHIQHLVSEVKILQATFMSTYSKTMLVSISRITKSLEFICAYVYTRLTDDTDEVVKDMLMNGMYAILHYCMQLNLASSSKALGHNILPQEITILSCIRSIFVTLSVLLISACPLVLDGQSNNLQQNNLLLHDEELSAEGERAIIDIIHYGRPLFLSQNPLIVVEYDETKEVNEVFKNIEDDLFKEDDVLIDDHSDVWNNNHSSDHPRSRPISVMIPKSFNPNPHGHDYSSLRNQINKPTFGREKSYFNSIETNLRRRSLLMRKSPSNDSFVQNQEKNDKRLSMSPNTLSQKETVSTTIKKPTHTRNLSFNKGTLRKQSFLRTRIQVTGKSQSINEAEVNKTNQEILDRVEPWTDIPSDDINENNLPDGYPPPPPIPVYEKSDSQEVYKTYMKLRYLREEWENKLIVYKRKLKAQQELLK